MTKKQNNALILTIVLVVIILFFVFRKKLADLLDQNLNIMKFSPATAAHLNQLNPQYRYLFEQFIDGVIKMGYKEQINSSQRSFAKQATLYAENPKNAKPGYSYHNYGLAIDVQLSKNGKTYGKNNPKDWPKEVTDLAKSLGLRWGGNAFAGYVDAVHFDFPIKSTTELLALAKTQYNTTDPTKIKGNELNIA